MLYNLVKDTLLRESYIIDPERCYIAGFSGGGRTATRIAAARPETFKGGIYMAGTVFWGDRAPPKIDLIKQNHHVFLVGTYDPALKDTQRVYTNYRTAGIENAKLITVRNHRHKMPPSDYFVEAIAHLDSRITWRDGPPQAE